MSDIARTFFVGRLTHDMEFRGEGKVGSFAIAVNRYAGPERGEQVSFFECALFGKAVQSLAPYLKKGRQVAIEAEPVQRSWKDVLTGQKKTAISFNVRNIQLLDRGSMAEGGNGGRQHEEGAPADEPRSVSEPGGVPPGQAAAPQQGPEQFIDDLPF